ncbi:MAG: hypothetical protein JSS75_01380 [Bacteroidetes bacterium]|nr:hypothetical protein [Bacteroidota bacterium]
MMFRAAFDANERSGGASKRLSERYGIPESEVQNLLYGTQSASAPNIPLPSVKGEPAMPTAVERNSRWNPVSILGALLGVVGVLSLVVVIMMLQRDRMPELPATTMHHLQMPPEMPPQAPPPAPESGMAAAAPKIDSCCMPSSPKTTEETSANEPSSEKPSTTPKKRRTVSHPRSTGYSTTNSMEAEEHLAELRAEGNAKAKISSSTKNGVTTYTVR